MPPVIKKSIYILFVLMFCITPLAVVAPAVAADQTPGIVSPPVVISELQTGDLTQASTEDGRLEFIEIHNTTDQPVDVTGWQLNYLSASNANPATPTRTITTFSGTIVAQGYVLISYQGYLPNADVYFGDENTGSSGFLARSGGHVQLADDSGATIDLVGWELACLLQVGGMLRKYRQACPSSV